MSSLGPVTVWRVFSLFPGREVNSSSERQVLDPEPHSKTHKSASLPAGKCLVLVSACTIPAGSTQPLAAGLVEGLILETEGSSQLLKLSHRNSRNSRGSKVTFQAGSLGF